MHPLELYYRRQAGGGSETVIGPIYSTAPYLQRGHGIGNFFGQSISLVSAHSLERGRSSRTRDFTYRRRHFIRHCGK